MNQYIQYISKQEISSEGHEKLLKLTCTAGKRQSRAGWTGAMALAACCLLVLGLWKMLPVANPQEGEQSQPIWSGGELHMDASSQEGFLAGDGDVDRLMFPMIPYIHYQQVDSKQEVDASIALPKGSFDVDLTREDIQTLFWGAEEMSDPVRVKTEQLDLPWMLFWDGYEVSGRGIYDGEGNLFWLMLFGSHESGSSFELELALGHLPPTCLVESGLETSEVDGTEVAGWSRVYDRNGDKVLDYICGSEFMAGDVGVRFENVGSPFQTEYGEGMELNGAAQFNALFVRQVLSEEGGLYLEHLRINEDIPEWRDEEFQTLVQARWEKEFAPYLPAENVPGYGEFYGRMVYQDEQENNLFVRWSRGYDDVEVSVSLPEGDIWWGETVDINNPASYDTRLYQIPWADSVPEEYRSTFFSPIFRAEDMSLAAVEARETKKDTGGVAYRFGVLHPDGTLVKYSCSGLTARQVWELVEDTL